MAVKIRLSRYGAKKHAYYRIVVADGDSPRDGRYLEQVGTYDPHPTPPTVNVKREKLEKWLSRGAKPTDTVAHVLKRAGLPYRLSPAVAAPAEPASADAAPASA